MICTACASVRAVDPERRRLRAVGDHAQLRLAELQAAVEIDEATVRRETFDHRVRPECELLERQVPAQLDLHRSFVRATAHHLRRIEDPDLAPGIVPERSARLADQLLNVAIALARAAPAFRTAFPGWPVRDPPARYRPPRRTSRPLPAAAGTRSRRARGTRASTPPTSRVPSRSPRRRAPRRRTGTARPRASGRTRAPRRTTPAQSRS